LTLVRGAVAVEGEADTAVAKVLVRKANARADGDLRRRGTAAVVGQQQCTLLRTRLPFRAEDGTHFLPGRRRYRCRRKSWCRTCA
jgi:hypothetical protein